MARLASTLLRPIVSACLASMLTAVLLGGPPKVETVHEVKVRELVPGPTRIIKETTYVCAGKTVAKLDNDVTDSSARSGAASADNGSDGRVGSPLGGSAHATGDNAAAASQNGTASSGLANLGQILGINASCSRVNVVMSNQVSDSQARSGDSEVNNDARVAVGSDAGLALPSPSPSPTPGGETEAVTPPDTKPRFRFAPVSSSPEPTLTSSPSPF